MTTSALVRPTTLYQEYRDPAPIQENDLRRHLVIPSTDFSEALGVFKRFQASLKRYIADALETQIPYDLDDSTAPSKYYTYFLNPNLEPVKRIVAVAKTLFEKEILPRLDRSGEVREAAKQTETLLAFLDKEKEAKAIHLDEETLRPLSIWTNADFLFGIQEVLKQIEEELDTHSS